MTRHPSEFFIKFLMTQTRPEAQDDKWVLFTVKMLGFPAPTPEYLKQVRDAITPKIPVGYKPNDRYHRESVKFLREERIWSLHNPDEATRGATLMVTNLRVRPVLEQLLLGRIDPKDIAKKINARFGEFYTTAGVESYAHYYWNVGLLKVEDWAVLFEQYEQLESSRTMAILKVGPSMALHVTGFQQSVESKVILREMMETVYFDFKEWKAQPRSDSKTRALATLAKAATTLDVQLSQADSALKEQLRAFEQFRMRHAESRVPDIREIAPEGNYSQSGAKLLEAPHTEGEPK